MRLPLRQRNLNSRNSMAMMTVGILACCFSQVADARAIIIYNSLHRGESAPARTWAIATSVVAFIAEIATLGILWLVGARLLTARRTSRSLGKDGEFVEEEEMDDVSEVRPLSARAQKVLWIIFSSFLVCAPLFLVIYYPIFAIQALSPWYFQQYAQEPNKSAVLSGTVSLLSNLADISVAGTFMALIYHHRHIVFQSLSVTAWKTCLDTMLGVGMVVLTIAEVAFSYRTSTTATFKSIHHAFVALYCIFIMNIFLSAFHLSKKLRESGIDDTVCFNLLIICLNSMLTNLLLLSRSSFFRCISLASHFYCLKLYFALFPTL